ncbi:hypothetical protein AYI70_g1083 [Smittium culicis]|uniref:Uncharacterized protein n=1 Tax=Smittium culicis TaxID=133412 RepID=A0A1R1YE69_9FUNG|nr:hypothetical protein AYI70_g1083 [Smittium culicis]
MPSSRSESEYLSEDIKESKTYYDSLDQKPCKKKTLLDLGGSEVFTEDSELIILSELVEVLQIVELFSQALCRRDSDIFKS